MRTNVAFGFRVHSGSAAFVALGGSADAPVVIERGRVQLVDSASPGPFQPYHRAAEMNLAEAEIFLEHCSEGAGARARHELGEVLGRVRERGCAVCGCGILFGSGRQPGRLAQILASHAMIHTAEGEFFRNALAGACEHHGLTVNRVKERELPSIAEKGVRHLSALGKAVGPPWRQDEKFACLAAWIVLATS